MRRHHNFDRAYWVTFRGLAPKGYRRVQLEHAKMVVDTNDLFVSALLMRDSVYEEFESALFKNSVQAGSVVVDVGAQIGYYTTLAASRCGKLGHVFSFEPDLHNYKLLAENVRINNYTNVITTQKAVTAGSGRRTFYIDGYNLGKHSLAMRNVLAIDGLEGTTVVDTVGLDEYLRSVHCSYVDVVKVDAEGAEGLVIDGALETLRQSRATLFIEVWPFGQRNLGTDPDQMFSRIRELGYDAYLIDESNRQLRKMSDSTELFKTQAPRSSFNFIFRRAS